MAFVGETDSGKSAWMRAMRYLFLLDPAYPSTGGGDVSVQAKFSDVEVSRDTSYSGDKKTHDGLSAASLDEQKSWDSLKRELPEGFTALTGINELQVEDVESAFSLNFIGQLDRVLPLALKPSQISKIFGAISGRNAIDSAIKETNLQTTRIREMLKSTEDVLFREKEKLSRAEGRMPGIDRKEIESIISQIEEHEDIATTCKIVDRLEDTGRALSKARPKQAILDSLDEVITEARDELELLKEINAVSSSIKDLPKLKRKEDVAVIPDEIDNEYGLLARMAYYFNEFSITEQSVMETEESLKKANTKAEEAAKELNGFLDENGACPYSGEKLPSACRKRLGSA